MWRLGAGIATEILFMALAARDWHRSEDEYRGSCYTFGHAIIFRRARAIPCGIADQVEQHLREALLVAAAHPLAGRAGGVAESPESITTATE